MPHLTPMNWILSLSLIWFLLSVINSFQWWNLPLKFPKTSKSTTKSTNSSWSW